MSAAATTWRCPLCHGRQCRPLRSLDPAVLRQVYHDKLGVHIELQDCGQIDYLQCLACDLRFFSPPLAGGVDFYRQLQNISWYYREEKPEYAIAAGHIDAADDVLEIGAGKGAFARHVKCASYVGLETSPDAILQARHAGIELRQQELHEHALAHANTYDAICAFQVLEHVPDPRGFLEDAQLALREEGKLIIAVPSEDSFASIDFWDVLNMPPHHLTRWSDLSLRNAARLLGLRLVAIEHEILPDRDVHWYARIASEYGMALRAGHEPQLLDPFMQRWKIRRGAKLAASILRRALRNPALRPAGHAVVAILQKQDSRSGSAAAPG